MTVSIAVLLATITLVPMLFEWWVSMRNERQLRGQGAVEPAGDVYALMQVAYPASFAASRKRANSVTSTVFCITYSTRPSASTPELVGARGTDRDIW